MRRSAPARFASALTASLAWLLLGGCARLASQHQKEVSFRRYESLTIDHTSLADFLQKRTGVSISGAEPQLQSDHAHAVDIRIKPIAHDEFVIGSITALTPDGYYLTARHCVPRRPVYLLLPQGQSARIALARVVWAAPADANCDLAILKADVSGSPVFFQADLNELHPQQPVVTAGVNGLAGGKLLTIDDSIIHATARTPSALVILHTAPLAEGDSGGPLTTLDGKLIGVEVLARGLMFGSTQGIALWPDSRWLWQTIDRDRVEHRADPDPRPPSAGNRLK